jgi:hypothetical protein
MEGADEKPDEPDNEKNDRLDARGHVPHLPHPPRPPRPPHMQALPDHGQTMVRATDVVRYASGVSEATAARRVRRIAQTHAVDMALVGRVRYCDQETAARVTELCTRPCLAGAIGARFEVVADAYAACRGNHIAGETDMADELRELDARLTSVEWLLERALTTRAAAHEKKIGYMRA